MPGGARDGSPASIGALLSERVRSVPFTAMTEKVYSVKFSNPEHLAVVPVTTQVPHAGLD